MRRDAEDVTRTALIELAGYYRGESGLPADFVRPVKRDEGKALGWTKAEISYFQKRLSKKSIITRRESEARLRLPPDLVALDRRQNLTIHLERETRGWEWNDVIGALAKMLVVQERPAPVVVLVLANVSRGARGKVKERIDLICGLVRRLLLLATGVRRAYLALWLGSDWTDARVWVAQAGRHRTAPIVRQIYPSPPRLANKASNAMVGRGRPPAR